MRKLYLVASSEAIARKELTDYIESIPECSDWFYSIPNCTFVFASMSAHELFTKVRNRFPGDSRMFVTEVPTDNCQGWIPQKHWNLIYANDVVHDYDLRFDGYWVSGDEHLLPNYSGIYCVYSCKDNFSNKTVSLTRLLYIGRAENINERHKCHEKIALWKSCLNIGETLCYSCAALPKKSLVICESALICAHQPLPCNETGDKAFWHDKTHIKTSGCNRFLKPDFNVSKTVSA